MISLIVEQIVNEVISEASYTEEDVPDFFYLALPDSVALKNGLLNRRFTGFKNKGISSKRDIIEYFGPPSSEQDDFHQNMLIIMPGREVVKNNKLTRFMYDNPDYWFSGKLENIERLFGGKYNHKENLADRLLRGEILPLLGYETKMIWAWIRKLKEDGYDINKLRSVIPDNLRGLAHFARVLKGISDMVREVDPAHVEEYLGDEPITTNELKSSLESAFKKFNNYYKYEGEWMSKDDVFNIPSVSHIIVYPKKATIPYLDELKSKYATVKTLLPKERVSSWI